MPLTVLGGLGWGGAWEHQLGQPMGPLAQEPDRMDDGWLANLFIWHISYPKATPSDSQITRATAARDRTDQAADRGENVLIEHKLGNQTAKYNEQ